MMQNIVEFIRAALPWVLMGLALALFIVAWHANGKESPLPRSQQLLRSGWMMLLSGLCCYGLAAFIGDMEPFEDQQFVRGFLYGMQIVLMIQGVYRLGLALGYKKDEDKKD